MDIIRKEDEAMKRLIMEVATKEEKEQNEADESSSKEVESYKESSLAQASRNPNDALEKGMQHEKKSQKLLDLFKVWSRRGAWFIR
jgi:hypothetical protein